MYRVEKLPRVRGTPSGAEKSFGKKDDGRIVADEYQMRKYRPGIEPWLSRDISRMNDIYLYGFCMNSPATHLTMLSDKMEGKP